MFFLYGPYLNRRNSDACYSHNFLCELHLSRHLSDIFILIMFLFIDHTSINIILTFLFSSLFYLVYTSIDIILTFFILVAILYCLHILTHHSDIFYSHHVFLYGPYLNIIYSDDFSITILCMGYTSVDIFLTFCSHHLFLLTTPQ